MRNLTAAFFLALAFIGPVRAFGPSSMATPADLELSRRVKGSLSATIGPRARDIEVIAQDGFVALHGRVNTSAAREAAQAAAERTPGVRAVANNLELSTRG